MTRTRKKPFTALGALIDERLHALGHTRGWLADEVDVSKQALHKWLYGDPTSGAVSVSRAKVAALARALGLPVEILHAAAGDAKSGAAAHTGGPSFLSRDAAEWRLIEAYRDAEENVRLAIRIMLGIEGTDPSSDPKHRRGASPPGARSTKHQP